MGDGSVTIGYRLTKRGQELLSRISEFSGDVTNRRSYKTQFEHDQLLIDIRRILEQSPIVKEFKTEAQLRRELLKGKPKNVDWENAGSIPDATFIYEVPGQRLRVAIELELSDKKRRRYKKIFRNHLTSKDWNLVFYIVKNVNLLTVLRAALAESKATDVHVRVSKAINGIYFCLLEEFLSKELGVTFSDGKQEFSLAEVAKNFGLER